MRSNTITFRVTDEMKEVCREILDEYGMSVSDYCRLCFEYLVQTGRPAVQMRLVSDEDSERMVRERSKSLKLRASARKAIEGKALDQLASLKKSLDDF
jgi:addiction module RelB/DinJ family antitoxin